MCATQYKCGLSTWSQYSAVLTLSSTVVSNGYTLKFIRALWPSKLSARVPECQKIKKGGLDQYGAERFGRLIFATIRENVGLRGLK